MDIRDIAARSGYGVGTVSRVLNDQPNVSDKARERILAVMRECGYEPNSNARFLKMRAQTSVAAFVNGTDNRLFGDILARLQLRLSAAGEDLSVSYVGECDNSVQAAVRYQQLRHPKAFLFLGGDPAFFTESFSQIEVPSVLVTASAEGLPFPNLSSVSIDNVSAAREAVEHLWQRGHRRIGVIGGTLSPDDQVSETRLHGARLALEAHGATLDLAHDFEPCNFNEDSGYVAADRLLDRAPDLTAVFALGDVIAFGALRALRDRGLSVPEDVSLMGFDGSPLARYAIPRITTVRQDPRLLAERACRILLDALSGAPGPVHELVGYELLVQESVRAL